MIRHYRLKNKLTQEELAEELGISWRQLQRLEYDEEKKIAKIEQRNHFKLGDVVEFFGPNTETFTEKIHSIYNEDNEKLDVARHPKMICYVNCSNKVMPNDMMRIKIFDKNMFL